MGLQSPFKKYFIKYDHGFLCEIEFDWDTCCILIDKVRNLSDILFLFEYKQWHSSNESVCGRCYCMYIYCLCLYVCGVDCLIQRCTTRPIYQLVCLFDINLIRFNQPFGCVNKPCQHTNNTVSNELLFIFIKKLCICTLFECCCCCCGCCRMSNGVKSQVY